ncbi:uncharacterized protein PHACADRAFT_202485 [Phanerochaete carnosa HHB-10118-sp]|uniref:Uncharacterized protein n=1 Tax=Phanerochaete carnosa (strain HHB-10118-sp) TaxID=650164 RepID=K5WEW4_PHACS|nr:uncharacterized protein PHACADRAFT_202485 [Phanerochaete carnosa HHB-10118-sp]EKM48717.1 hypothetical protein PHACADRAFT_202485 [Phanerochaete carnosa HHB-10118-sp]
MSTQPDQALVQAYSQLTTGDYVAVAAACKYILHYPLRCSHSICPSGLPIYELLITFDNEIKIVWKRPVTASAVLLGSVRWCMLLTAVLQLEPSTQNFPVAGKQQIAYLNSTHSCPPLEIMTWIFTLLGFLQIAFTYVTRGSLVLADAIVLVLTWIKTFGHWKNARRLNMRVSLTTCLLRDGTIYFIEHSTASDLRLFYDTAPVSAFIVALPPVLISRFMINLRTVDSELSDYSVHMSYRQQEQPTLQIRRSLNRLGNIGGILQSGWGDELCDEENGSAEADEEGHCETSAEA